MKRREFCKSSLAFSALVGAGIPWNTYAANGRVRLACIGVGEQAWYDIKQFSNAGGRCQFVALCDTDMGAKHTLPALEKFPDLPRYRDFRKMLEKEAANIDAVAVVTPDFSHFPAAMMAMRMGKAVYVEKPLTHTFREAELLMAAERKYGVVCQMGNQGHSGDNFYQFRDYVEKGIIDTSKLVRLVGHMNNVRRWHKWKGNVDSFPAPEKVPDTLDWDTWLSTALPHGYSKSFVGGEWRSWFDFGNGCLGDWGAHTLDTMHRFFDLGYPTEVKIRDVSGWNRYVFPMQDTLTFRFAAKGRRPAIDLEWYEGVTNLPKLPEGYVFSGWNSSIPKAAGSSAADAKKLKPGKFFELSDGSVWQGGSHSAPISKIGVPSADLPSWTKPKSGHYLNFLNSVLGEEKPQSPFSVSGPLSQVFCLGCIAQRLNRDIRFDPETKRIIGDDIADSLLHGPEPRKGWEEFYSV